MLNRLVLTNVRRHAHTEIDFDADAQLIALSGLNGAGKSTVLEAILYALYGETRHGRAGIADMVRRGAEHEGMEVFLSFTVGGVGYEVTRRYEKGKSTASLKASGKEVMRSVAGVTQEVCRVLGMDAAGFKMATIAKQKELDGLADLTSAKRRAAVGRLMRLDAIAAAARAAREEFNEHRAVSLELSRYADTPTAQAACAEREVEVGEAVAAYEAQAQVLGELTASLQATEQVAQEWDEVMRKVADANGRVEVLRAQCVEAETAVAAVEVPPAVAKPRRERSEVEAELASLAAAVARAEAASAVAAQRDAVAADLRRAESEYESLQDQAAKLHGVKQRLEQAETAHQAAQKILVSAGQEHQEAVLGAARCAAQVEAARGRVAQLSELGSTCPVCEQEITEQVHERQLGQASTQLRDAEAAAREASSRRARLEEAVAEAQQELTRAGDQVSALREQVRESERVETTLTHLGKAIRTYNSTLERLQVEDVDVEALYVRKAEVEVENAELSAWEANCLDRAGALARLDQLTANAANLAVRLTEAEQAAEEVAPSLHLQAAMAARQEAVKQVEEERDILTALAESVTVAKSSLAAAVAARDAAAAAAKRMQEHQHKAQVASKSAQVLTEVGKRLALETRPHLESELTTLLYAVSEGRFTAVKVSEEYEVSVQDDDGKFYPVGEFSGGESDLIALAVRLALAQVVAKRHGADTAGFLILDEVLGSQDAGRRAAIMEGLRRLRGVYGQILLISHVGGLEDAADRVINVEVEDGVSTAA